MTHFNRPSFHPELLGIDSCRDNLEKEYTITAGKGFPDTRPTVNGILELMDRLIIW